MFDSSGTTGLSFKVLGPLDVLRGGQRIELRAGKLRVFLAALLVRANQPVSMDELTEHLWGERAPRSARSTLQVHAMRLRRVLADGPRVPQVLHTTSDGYAIEVGADQLDLAQFEQLRKQAHDIPDGGDLRVKSELLAAAVELWRGPALCDIPSESLQRDVVSRLAEDRLLTIERRVDVDLALGRHQEVVGELVQLSNDHPWHEPFWEQLITALQRSGRHADALDTYHTVLGRFRSELGVEPNERLRALYHALLAGEEPARVRPGRTEQVPAGTTGGPHQLPLAVRDFAGRRELTARIVAEHRAAGTATPIVAVTGMPGVGKTAFALHVAHRLRPHFTDGQLYLNLQGHAAAAPPLPVDKALERLLTALEVAAFDVPADTEDRAARYRSLLAGRRVLVVLDDAVSADQVRPLLPGDDNCLVLVTGRNDLRGLTATHGAEHIALGPLTPIESCELLGTLIGRERVRAEPEAVRALAARCAHLPLALRITGVNIAADPHGRVADHLRGLRGPGRLDHLAVDGDGTAAVSAAFETSYTRLSWADQRFFQRLGDCGDGVLTAETVALLTGCPPGEAEQVLGRLAREGLVQRPAAGRYQLDELVREYAARRAALEPAGPVRAVHLDVPTRSGR